MDNEGSEFKNEQEKTVKSIINRIKTHYFNFLSSLKFENIIDKKTEKDHFRMDMK